MCRWAWVSPCPPPLLAGVVGRVWLCARSACTPPFLARVCGVGNGAWALVSAAPRHSWLGCCGLCVFVCTFRLYPATPGWGVQGGYVCLGSGFGCASPLLAGVLGCVCVCVGAPLVPRHSWLGCAVWVCVLGLGFWLRPTAPSWGVGIRVCLCARSACTPPLLAGVCGVGVTAWAQVSAAPRHSWLGCGGCVCLCARSACTAPLLAGVCGVGVWAWARASAALRHPWLGCWALCVFVCALRLYPATPGLGARCGFVCLGSGFGCAPPLLARGLGSVFVCVRAPLVPSTPGWGVRCGCVCLGSGFGCAPPLLAGVLGSVCVCVRAPLAPRHSWLGCAVWVCVFGLGFRLRPATPGWGVGVFVCLCARSACTPPLVAGVCGGGVCGWARVSVAPPSPGCGVGVCVCLCARSACTPPLLAGVYGVGVCASPRG